MKILTNEEEQSQKTLYQEMIKIQMQEVAPKELKELMKSKKLGPFLQSKSDQMIKDMKTLMREGLQKNEAVEIVVQQHIIEM